MITFSVASIIGIAATAMNKFSRNEWQTKLSVQEAESELQTGQRCIAHHQKYQPWASYTEIDEIANSLILYRQQIATIGDASNIVSLYFGTQEDVGYTKHALLSEALYKRVRQTLLA
jgi:hypothetical protein